MPAKTRRLRGCGGTDEFRSDRTISAQLPVIRKERVMFPVGAFCCRGPSMAAEQAAIASDAQKLGFVVRRQIEAGQATLILTKKIRNKEINFTVTDQQGWEVVRTAVLRDN